MFLGIFGRAAASITAVVLLTASVPDQSGASTIAGLRRDATGASIPGVLARAIDEDTSVSAKTVTDDRGPGLATNDNLSGFPLGAADFGAISSARPARTR